MRTSLIEIEQIENWLLEQGNVQERLVTEAKVLSNPALQEKVFWQSKSYQLIQLYGREKLLQEIKVVERQLFNSKKHKSFQQRIKSIFKK